MPWPLPDNRPNPACPTCNGKGTIDTIERKTVPCPDCNGSGRAPGLDRSKPPSELSGEDRTDYMKRYQRWRRNKTR